MMAGGPTKKTCARSRLPNTIQRYLLQPHPAPALQPAWQAKQGSPALQSLGPIAIHPELWCTCGHEAGRTEREQSPE